jgi:hypothetical protein
MKASITLIAIALLGAFVTPSAAPAQTVTEDSVTGSGTAGDVSGHNYYSFAFDAHSGPSGENPSGTAGFWLTAGPWIRVSGSVTCLAVQGKRAVIGIANDADSLFGGGTLFEVTDDPDTITLRYVDPAPKDCSTGVTEIYPVTSGDITITDAQDVPTSKEQCKNGGWRNFPGFKNQGGCVSYATHNAVSDGS